MRSKRFDDLGEGDEVDNYNDDNSSKCEKDMGIDKTKMTRKGMGRRAPFCGQAITNETIGPTVP